MHRKSIVPTPRSWINRFYFVLCSPLFDGSIRRSGERTSHRKAGCIAEGRAFRVKSSSEQSNPHWFALPCEVMIQYSLKASQTKKKDFRHKYFSRIFNSSIVCRFCVRFERGKSVDFYRHFRFLGRNFFYFWQLFWGGDYVYKFMSLWSRCWFDLRKICFNKNIFYVNWTASV